MDWKWGWPEQWHWLEWSRWGLVPLMSALVGWGTNVLAIKMLFHPRTPWRVPLLGWQLQGVLPRRQADLARQLGEVVERELLCADDLAASLTTPEVRSQVAGVVARRVGERVGEWLPPFLPGRWRDNLIQVVQEVARRESETLLAGLWPELVAGLRQRVSVAKMVQTRVQALELEELENLILTLSRRELRLIEILGGVLGFVIGVGQLLAMLVVEYLIR